MKSRLGFILAIIYLAVFGVALIMVALCTSRFDCWNPALYVTLPWIKWLTSIAQPLAQRLNYPGILRFIVVFVGFIPNVLILYFVGFGIEKLIKNRKTQPSSYAKASEDETPNQGQPPKV